MTDLAGIPEALHTQVVQLRAERANAVAYGQHDIVAGIDRALDALGLRATPESEEEPKDMAEQLEQARTQAPQGRNTGPRRTTGSTAS